MTTRGLRKGSQGGSVAIAGIAYKDKGDVTTNRLFFTRIQRKHECSQNHMDLQKNKVDFSPNISFTRAACIHHGFWVVQTSW